MSVIGGRGWGVRHRGWVVRYGGGGVRHGVPAGRLGSRVCATLLVFVGFPQDPVASHFASPSRLPVAVQPVRRCQGTAVPPGPVPAGGAGGRGLEAARAAPRYRCAPQHREGCVQAERGVSLPQEAAVRRVRHVHPCAGAVLASPAGGGVCGVGAGLLTCRLSLRSCALLRTPPSPPVLRVHLRPRRHNILACGTCGWMWFLLRGAGRASTCRAKRWCCSATLRA